MKIGVLALQGAFIEHIQVLQQLDVEASPVRLPEELDGLNGLIIPGGESTTMSRLMLDLYLMQPIKNLAEAGFPIMGTCAGMILLAKTVPGFPLRTLGLMDITVRRNAFGSQIDSFETDLEIPVLGKQPFHAVFIRAPIIEKANSTVEILGKLSNGTTVAARQGKLIAAAFHPELTADLRFHKYFLDVVGLH
ncbi:MAG: pyridoxal 5'-phosphate synthase glutaminase subunit PdxT [Chloroflexi bacterium]|nr:pyridoxal 5'-phosphate synthase glutaminase subunit PdxT [Chloroflexota bacterium]